MQLFLDTEFTDILWPELISLGLVSDCGEFEFYGELTDFNRRACTRFVWKEVLPKLGRVPGVAMDRPTLGAALSSWIEQLPTTETITVAFDFEGDWELIVPLLSESALKRCAPSHVWRFIMTDYLPPKLQMAAPKDAHHALCDARVLRANWLAANAVRLDAMVDKGHAL
jgi:hypothetical protein